MTAFSKDVVHRLPKVALHEHLDGGLRPSTIIDLAAQSGIALPTTEPAELALWFERGADVGNLAQYLEGFAVTTSVMQSAEALHRVAFEALEDLAKDGVVYAEIRFAPEFHTGGGLPLEGVMEAVLGGMRAAEKAHGIRFGLLVCGMRSSPPSTSLQMAELAVAHRDRGCRGFDLAGDEFGHPPKDHLEAFHLCQRENFNITIHAGEAFGPQSIWQALQYCGAHRIGHCTRLTEDMVIEDDRVLKMGPLASYILDHRIPLEICLSSNVHTGAVKQLDDHPFRLYLQHGYRVTLNTDNRLMSGTTVTDEHWLAVERFGVSFEDLEKIVINGMKSAFVPYRERCDMIFDVLRPQFAKLRQELGLPALNFPAKPTHG